ncbi:proline dehydrogenase family protein [Stygiobacter electus]|uniref:proline dehydrogenase n=1 Tax=Stygiobacter electus TaxID=3032292 RepID=A0AAE3P1B1_9BACT|nr:proline dehydrogenase family protein [Stygiobacter electus]MDF1612425.1 proline dehydrogenase family protein [Stygiobacter electus]
MNPINSTIVNFVKILPKPAVYIFAKKYIAGEKLEDGVRVVKELNSKGILATMDVLGEAVTTKKESVDAKNECLLVLETIQKNNLNSNLSLKPTQLGLAIDEEFCYNQMVEIVERAKSYNNFVRIDMEDSPFTDATINLFKRLKEKYDNVGIVVQAYLKRTLDDVKKLNKLGTNYRLCKGIYIEPEEISYKDYQKVRDNYLDILRQMFTDGNYVGIATHDDYLVENAYKMIKEMNIPKDKFEFQMLYGVKENLRDRINADGYKIRIYVPFGEHWYKYSIRRLQENPNIAWYITKSIFSFN